MIGVGLTLVDADEVPWIGVVLLQSVSDETEVDGTGSIWLAILGAPKGPEKGGLPPLVTGGVDFVG